MIKKYLLQLFDPLKNKIEKNSISLDLPTLVGKNHDEEGNASFENFVHDYMDPAAILPKTIHEELSANEQAEICK